MEVLIADIVTVPHDKELPMHTKAKTRILIIRSPGIGKKEKFDKLSNFHWLIVGSG